jgi:hypothetical protein
MTTFPHKPPALPFGERGELTAETIAAADLTDAERERAEEILEAQQAYLDLFDTLSYPVDPEGNVYDLSAVGPPVLLALAWTLALNGFRRQPERQMIKKRFFNADQIVAGAHTWVDVRAPDVAILEPGTYSEDVNLAPDTRYLAAKRDGVEPRQMPTWTGVKPTIVRVTEPRPER